MINLTKIILNETNYDAQANSLQSELRSKYGELEPYVRMAEYSQDREDDDPLKGKGFGMVDFIIKDDVPEDVFNSIKLHLKNKGYEVQSSDRFFDSEPGERDYHPKINFHFNLETK